MPSDNQFSKRVQKLIADIKSATEQPPEQAAEPFGLQPLSETEELRRQVKALRAQVRELEDQLGEARPQSRAGAVAARLRYEKEQVGYVYHNDQVLPMQSAEVTPEELTSAVKTSLVAGGETIGEMGILPSPEKPWTPDEERLTSAVAQQVALQVQNLRLLSTTERARAEAQAATRRFTHENWESFLDGIRNSERIGYMYNQAEVAPFVAVAPDEHDLQETISVLDERIGSLFLKSDPAHPLGEEDQALVSAVARQLAQQVENLRLLADASRARADAEAATRRLVHESWQSFTAQHDQAALGFKYDSLQVTPLQPATYPQDITFVQPLAVRGETIGQLAVAGWKEIPPEAIEMASAIAERASTHIENLRLFELNEKRARELGTVAAIGTTATTVLNPEELLQTVVDTARERFNLYYADIYLTDETGANLILAAGAGEMGRQMLAAGHTIEVGARVSLIARAARERQAIIANDVYSEADYLPHPLLSETRSEMVIPMIVGDKIIGVFDVQAAIAGNFTQDDANIYTTLALQVAIALQNARLYVQQTATVAQLRELDRLKSSFLANMSHELRTPLNSILGFSDVMLEGIDGPLTEYMENDLKLIQKNGQHLLHLINDVLDMAKIEAGRMNLHPEKFRVYEVLEDVINITSSLANNKGLALYIESDSNKEVHIVADITRIRQVFINLVNNSTKFTENGEVTVRVDMLGADKIIVKVRDTGLGIPASHLEAIFQEFSQVDSSTTRKVGGTGLGLPISRRLVEMHGGRMWAESEGIPGLGTTMFVELPVEAQVVTEIVEKPKK